MSDQRRANFDNLGQIGLVFDMIPSQLPPNAWTNGSNIVFRRGSVYSAFGRKTTMGTPSVDPTFLIPFSTPDTDYWVYTGENKIYSIKNVAGSWVHTDITGTTTPSNNDYEGTILGGLLILNNGEDTPQVWDGETATVIDLSDWPEGIQAGTLKAYKNFLIAGDITDTGSPYSDNESLLWISDAAEPGLVPPAWEPANSNLADKIQLSSGGKILDIVPLHGTAMIYCETSIWSLQETSGVFVVNNAFPNIGMVSKNCVADIGGQHAVLTTEDLILHDSRSYQSLIADRSKNYMFKSIDPAAIDSCYVLFNPEQNEIWCCYPLPDSTYADRALIIDINNKTTSVRSLSGYAYGTVGPVVGDDETWNNDSQVWNQDLTKWNETSSSVSRKKLFFVDTANTLFWYEDNGYYDNEGSISAYIEREDLIIPGGNSTEILLLQAIYPYIDIVGSADIQFYIGSRYYLSDAITWNGPYDFNPSDQYKIDLSVSGRYFTFKFKWNAGGRFALHRYDLDYIPIGHAWK